MARILLAEDDHTTRQTLHTLLTDQGHTVMAAVDMLDAQQRYHIQQPFDLIITGWSTPIYRAGLELLRFVHFRNYRGHVLIHAEEDERPRNAVGSLENMFRFKSVNWLEKQPAHGFKNLLDATNQLFATA